jgi:hypothetical protein
VESLLGGLLGTKAFELNFNLKVALFPLPSFYPLAKSKGNLPSSLSPLPSTLKIEREQLIAPS